MIVKYYFSRIFTVLIAFLTIFQASTRAQKYVPPASNRYSQQIRSQTSRNPAVTQIDFEILAPNEYIAATSLERPIFYLEFHKILEWISFDITIETISGKIVYSRQFKVKHTGISSLPIETSLPEGRYVLSISSDCPSACQGIRIAFDHKNLSEEEKKTLNNLAFSQDKSTYLAEIGYYYDAIHYQLAERAFSFSYPHNYRN